MSTKFEDALRRYKKHFGKHYPNTVGFGFPADTDEENIAIIDKCISENKPYKEKRKYISGVSY